MKTYGKPIAAAVAVLTLVLTLLTACSGKPSATVNIEPVKNGLTGRPTVAVPEKQMVFTTLMEMNGLNISWEKLSRYDHAVIDEDSVVFAVADTYGEECSLYVDYNPETDAVTRADVVYGDMTLSILTDDDIVLMQLLRAFEQTHLSKDAEAAANPTQAE